MRRALHALRLGRELALALWEQRRWWLLPVVIGCAFAGAAIAASGSSLGAFMYALL